MAALAPIATAAMDVLGLITSGNGLLISALQEEKVDGASVVQLARGRNPFGEDVDDAQFEIMPFAQRVLVQNANIRVATSLPRGREGEGVDVEEPGLRLLMLLKEQNRLVNLAKENEAQRTCLSKMLMAMPSPHFWDKVLLALVDSSLYEENDAALATTSADAETHLTDSASLPSKSADVGKTHAATLVPTLNSAVPENEVEVEQILVEKGGKFVLVDADKVTAADSGISELTLESSQFGRHKVGTRLPACTRLHPPGHATSPHQYNN